MLKKITLPIFALALVACGDSPDDDTAQVEQSNIAEVATANGNFTTLLAAATAVGLDAALIDETKQYTVFAPTDAAFDAAFTQEELNNLLGDTDKLTDVLQYHIIEGEVKSDVAISLAGTTVDMLNGEKTALSLSGDDLYINLSRVETPDVDANNGVIHVIDKVLLPKVVTVSDANIVGTAIADDQFSILVELVQAANLVDALSDAAASLTVFAPTNDAFNALGQTTLDALKADIPTLTKILTKHVVPVEADSIAAFAANGKTLPTLNADGEVVAIDIVEGKLLVDGIDIILTDIETTNGTIHAIDEVILLDQ